MGAGSHENALVKTARGDLEPCVETTVEVNEGDVAEIVTPLASLEGTTDHTRRSCVERELV